MGNVRIVDGTGRFVYRLRGDGTAAVLECLEEVRELRIPAYLDGVAVTKLDDGAIERAEYEVVHIPSTVDCVHEAAFMADNVAEIAVDEGNDRFGIVNGALVEKATGTIVAFPPAAPVSVLQIPEGIRAVGDYAFSTCRNLKQVILPEPLTSIGYEAFEHCEALTSINLPASVESIGSDAFADCPNLQLRIHPRCYNKIWGYFRDTPNLLIELTQTSAHT